MNNAVAGFSKLSKEDKINWIATEYFTNPTEAITTIKQLGAYGNIATAYPDYEMQESLFEIKITPSNTEQAKDLITKTTVTLSL